MGLANRIHRLPVLTFCRSFFFFFFFFFYYYYFFFFFFFFFYFFFFYWLLQPTCGFQPPHS
jgi:hypothetical protein